MSVVNIKHTPEFGPAYLGKPSQVISSKRPVDVLAWTRVNSGYFSDRRPALGAWVQVWYSNEEPLHKTGKYMGYRKINNVYMYQLETSSGKILEISDDMFPAFAILSQEDGEQAQKELDKEKELIKLTKEMAAAKTAEEARLAAAKQKKYEIDQQIDNEMLGRTVSLYENELKMSRTEAEAVAAQRNSVSEYRGAVQALDEVLKIYATLNQYTTYTPENLHSWITKTNARVKSMRDAARQTLRDAAEANANVL